MRTLRIQTARLSYNGPDRLDITRLTGTAGEGLAFAPSWAILRPALDGMRRAARARKAGDPEADAIELAAWNTYVPAYMVEMRASWKTQRSAWVAVLCREHVVFCCFCARRERCHRGLLARFLVVIHEHGPFVEAGLDAIVDEGEVPPPVPPQLKLFH